MTSIRIAIASALAIGALIAGGTAHAAHSARPAARHAVLATAIQHRMGPVSCCMGDE